MNAQRYFAKKKKLLKTVVGGFFTRHKFIARLIAKNNNSSYSVGKWYELSGISVLPEIR